MRLPYVREYIQRLSEAQVQEGRPQTHFSLLQLTTSDVLDATGSKAASCDNGKHEKKGHQSLLPAKADST